jgi:hypothetical protein
MCELSKHGQHSQDYIMHNEVEFFQKKFDSV